MVKNNIILGIVMLLSSSLIYADWLDDLAQHIGPKAQWDESQAIAVINNYLKEDETHINDLENKIESNKNNGWWSSLHKGAYQVELATAKSQKNYHEKIYKALKDLPDNKKERDKLVSSLVSLYRNNNELEDLKKSLSSTKDTSEKIKLGAKIVAKQSEIAGRKMFIKSSFLLP